MASCHRTKRTDEDAMRKCNVVLDSTVNVRLAQKDSDSLTVYNYATNSSYRLAYRDTKWSGKISGSLNEGDTLAIVMNLKKKRVLYSVNLSELIGLWFFNMEQQQGLRLTADGGASSVNANHLALRSWDLYNGKFVLSYMADSAGELVARADTSIIDKLDKDHFQFTFLKKVYTCQRIRLITKPN